MIDSCIILEGWLDEGFRFKAVRAEESPFHLTKSAVIDDEPVRYDLRDGAGAILLAGGCEVRYAQGCGLHRRQVTSGWLRVSIPLHPEARDLRFMHDARELYRATIGSEPPTITLELVSDRAADTLRCRYAVSHPTAELTFTIVDETNRMHSVSPQRNMDTSDIELAPLAGLGRCRLRVSATHELRTGHAESEAFDTPDPIVSGRIIEPRDRAQIAPDQPLSLLGNLSIAQSGRAMQWDSEHCEWVVDGLKCGEDSCLALDSLDPGAHLIEMRYADEMGEFTVLDKATVMVRERSEAEWEYTALVARLDEQQAMARGQME